MEEQTPPSPPVIAFGDNKEWVLNEDMTYVIGSTTEQIVVPRGFVTDYASIPAPVQRLIGLTAHGQYSRAAIIHDYLYWAQPCTRAQADRLMVIAMKESNTRVLQWSSIYRGLQVGGEGAWQNNKKQRAANQPRIVPSRYIPPKDPNVNWRTYRAMLFKNGVTDPPFEDGQSYCSYGDTTDVP